MFRSLFVFAMLASQLLAQESRVIPTVKGTLNSEGPLLGNRIAVTLTDSLSHRETYRAFVNTDGGFEFRDLPAGTYLLEVATANGDAIVQQIVQINSSADHIDIRLPESQNKPVAGSGTISVQQLQHPLSSKSKKLLAAAEKESASGDYLKAIEILRGALNDPAAVPYARMNIGVAYIRAGQPMAAVAELREAVRLMPNDSVAHANLAYALILTKQMDAAEPECRKAIDLDRSNARARWLMGSILLNKGSHAEEAVEDLRFASREIPKARMMLAQYYERNGQKDAAARELREFLPQASGQDRAAVEQWLSKLTTK
jgi:Flp pilus assembly protein TadD